MAVAWDNVPPFLQFLCDKSIYFEPSWMEKCWSELRIGIFKMLAIEYNIDISLTIQYLHNIFNNTSCLLAS